MKKHSLITTLGLLIVVILCNFNSEIIGSERNIKYPRNIILFIGDGMGATQVYAAMTMSDNHLFLEGFP